MRSRNEFEGKSKEKEFILSSNVDGELGKFCTHRASEKGNREPYIS